MSGCDQAGLASPMHLPVADRPVHRSARTSAPNAVREPGRLSGDHAMLAVCVVASALCLHRTGSSSATAVLTRCSPLTAPGGRSSRRSGFRLRRRHSKRPCPRAQRELPASSTPTPTTNYSMPRPGEVRLSQGDERRDDPTGAPGEEMGGLRRPAEHADHVACRAGVVAVRPSRRCGRIPTTERHDPIAEVIADGRPPGFRLRWSTTDRTARLTVAVPAASRRVERCAAALGSRRWLRPRTRRNSREFDHTTLPVEVRSYPQLEQSWSTMRRPNPPVAPATSRTAGMLSVPSWTSTRSVRSPW